MVITEQNDKQLTITCLFMTVLPLEITWHCICGRLGSTLRVFCVHSAGVLRPLCGHPASTLQVFCVQSARGYSACVLRPDACVLLGSTHIDHHKISIQHIGQFTNVKKFRN